MKFKEIASIERGDIIQHGYSSKGRSDLDDGFFVVGVGDDDVTCITLGDCSQNVYGLINISSCGFCFVKFRKEELLGSFLDLRKFSYGANAYEKNTEMDIYFDKISDVIKSNVALFESTVLELMMKKETAKSET